MNTNDKVNILLVDDQPGKLLSYEVMLGELGENLIKATSGREALERLLAHEVAVVLMDVSMPDIDGFELAEMIRQHPRFQGTAIIFISAVRLTDLDRLKGYERGAVDYISVPVIPELLRAKVSVFAEMHRKTKQLDQLNRELERRVAERTQELRESENRFRTVANSIPQLAWMANPEGRIFWHNQRWYDYTGEKEEQAERWQSAIDPDFLDGARERWIAFMREGEPFEMELPLRRADGAHRWFLTQATPVRDEKGVVHRWFGTHTNIHEQRELRRELQEAQERLVMAQKAAHCGMFDWDLEHGTRRWSDLVAELYGFGPQQFTGTEQEWFQCMLPEDRESTIAAFQRSLQTGAFEADFRIRRRDNGEVRWMSARGLVRYDSAGKPVHVAGLSIDVTERKGAEEELKKAHDQLEARVQERTAELRAAEEDLRKLSGRLMQTQDQERRRIARELHDGLAQHLIASKMTLSMLSLGIRQDGDGVREHIADAMEQLDQAIAETRTMSYLLHPPLLDETGLKSAITWYAEGFAKRSGIEVNVDIAPGLGRLERDVETALFRVLQECLTNIHRHSGSESASIRLSRDAGEVRLEVGDRGKGFPASPSVATGPAAGIGIQGIRERMRQLSGRMQLVSQAGAGTTVIVTVPESARVNASADVFETEAP